MTTMNKNAAEIVQSLVSAGGGRRCDKTRCLAYVPSTAAMFAGLAGLVKPQAGKTLAGVVVFERLRPHPDSLSVAGRWLMSTDTLAPECDYIPVWDRDGSPDVDHLVRDGGKLAKVTSQMF